MAIFTTVIHSRGLGELDFHEDEYQITAEEPHEAIAVALHRWERFVKAKWPDHEIEDAFILPADADPNTFDHVAQAVR